MPDSVLNLILSLVALGVGPAVVLLAGRVRTATVVLDAFVLVVVGGLVLLHVLPESIALGGWYAVGATVLGLMVPVLVERGMSPAGGMRGITIGLALAGMLVHAMLDGVALVGGGGHSHVMPDGSVHHHGGDTVLVWAVLAHRLPVGIGIWWIVGRTLGKPIALLTLAVTAIGTVIGWGVGDALLTNASQAFAGVFQALLAGSLLHVLLHAHVPAPDVSKRARHIASVVGAFAAVGIVWAVEASHSHATGNGPTSGEVFLELAIESAPVLVLAYLIAGLGQAFMPASWIGWVNRGSALRQTLRGIAVGLPIPVCSCGVVPIYRGLVARGAAIAAGVAFLIATPELEIAAVLMTWQLLGSDVAIARIVAAALLALIVGMTVHFAVRGRVVGDAGDSLEDEKPVGSLGERMRGAMRVGLVDMVDQTAPWILVGLGVSAMLAPYLDPETFAALPPGLDVPLAAALGMPLYVCASGSTPLAAVFVAQGLSPGAALAFLLTGPATNVTTYGVLNGLHGARTATVFAVATFAGSVGLGYAVNAVMPSGTAELLQAHGVHASPLAIVSMVVLGLLVIGSMVRRGTRGFLESLFQSPAKSEPSATSHSCH